MEFKNKSGETLDVALLSGRVETVAHNGTVTVTGDDAKAFADHPFFERVDVPAKRKDSDNG